MSEPTTTGGAGSGSRSERGTWYDPTELDRYVRSLDSSEPVLVLSQLTNGGAAERALDLCSAARAAGKGSRGIAPCEARALFLLGDAAGALARLATVLDAHPDDYAARFLRAQLLAHRGEGEAARSELSHLVRAVPDYPGALATLARLSFPGPGYREGLGWLHATLAPGVYLELGAADHGSLLRTATTTRRDPHRSNKAPERTQDHVARRVSRPAYRVLFARCVQAYALSGTSSARRYLELARRCQLAFDLSARLTEAASLEQARELAARSTEAARYLLLT